jgi:lipoprotein-releasing system permease protein
VRGVLSATPFVHQQALFTTAGRRRARRPHPRRRPHEPGGQEDIQSQLRQGSLEPLADGQPAILLGREMARTLGLFTGDSVTVISPEGAVTAVGMVPKMRGIPSPVRSRSACTSTTRSIAYLSLPAAKEFAGLVGVSGIEVKLTIRSTPARRPDGRRDARPALTGSATGWR